MKTRQCPQRYAFGQHSQKNQIIRGRRPSPPLSICPTTGAGVKHILPVRRLATARRLSVWYLPGLLTRETGVSEKQPTSAPEIAVIDDDNELLKLMVLLLRRLGAHTTTLADGHEALQYLANHVPDLIILDLMLPQVSGFEILQRVRSDARFEQVPVLVLSAKVDPHTIRQVLEAGADGYVTKPYIANSFVDRVRLLLTAGRQLNPPPEADPPAEPVER